MGHHHGQDQLYLRIARWNLPRRLSVSSGPRPLQTPTRAMTRSRRVTNLLLNCQAEHMPRQLFQCRRGTYLPAISTEDQLRSTLRYQHITGWTSLQGKRMKTAHSQSERVCHLGIRRPLDESTAKTHTVCLLDICQTA